MNIINNALSGKSVRVHGMSSAKWTTKDKITQYKGLVNLYKRDRQVSQTDTAVATKRQQKGLQALRKAIEADRFKLDNAINGDRQKLRNTLAEHKELQLAYQTSDPKKVTDNVHQINFTKRKALDRLRYQMKLKSQELIDLKLDEALLGDRLKYGEFGNIKEEKIAQIITGKVQDALLKKEAALAIQQTYCQIIDVMKKDALYFDGILLAIQNDYWYQCRCVLNAAKQGQLATEYKHDREQEFAALDEAIIQDMKTQRTDLEIAREEVENLHSNLKLLLRRDSDLTTCVSKIEDTQDAQILRRDLTRIEATLKFLRDTTLVSSFEQIYPSLQEQRRQKKRLWNFAERCEQNRDVILNKLNHAELMSNVLQNNMVETTGEYKKRKSELLQLIKKENGKRREFTKLQTFKCNLIAQVRISLRQLQQLCKPIKVQSEEKCKEQKKYERTEEIVPFEEDETDGRKIITEITPKLTFLMSVSKKLDDSKIDIAFKFYEILVKSRCVEPDVEVNIDKSMLEEFTSEAAHVLTREDIKKQSVEIVAANTKDDDFMIGTSGKKKKSR